MTLLLQTAARSVYRKLLIVLRHAYCHITQYRHSPRLISSHRCVWLYRNLLSYRYSVSMTYLTQCLMRPCRPWRTITIGLLCICNAYKCWLLVVNIKWFKPNSLPMPLFTCYCRWSYFNSVLPLFILLSILHVPVPRSLVLLINCIEWRA